MRNARFAICALAAGDDFRVGWNAKRGTCARECAIVRCAADDGRTVCEIIFARRDCVALRFSAASSG